VLWSIFGTLSEVIMPNPSIPARYWLRSLFSTTKKISVFIASFSLTKTAPDKAGGRAEVYFWNVIRTHYAQSIHSRPILTTLTVVNND